MARKTADVQLVDHRSCEVASDRPLATPVEGQVTHHGPQSAHTGVGRIGGAPAVPYGIGNSVRPGIQQLLTRIETCATRILVRGPIQAPAVVRARSKSFDEHVP